MLHSTFPRKHRIDDFDLQENIASICTIINFILRMIAIKEYDRTDLVFSGSIEGFYRWSKKFKYGTFDNDEKPIDDAITRTAEKYYPGMNPCQIVDNFRENLKLLTGPNPHEIPEAKKLIDFLTDLHTELKTMQ